jgi:hypothetical protein
MYLKQGFSVFKGIKKWVLLTGAPGTLVKELKKERKEKICIEKTKI